MSYKDMQEHYRIKSRPRMVPEEEWDDHDREFMKKTTIYNRKRRRSKLSDPKFTKYHEGEPGKRNLSRHAKRVARQKLRKELREARS